MTTLSNLDINLSCFEARYGELKTAPLKNLCKIPLTEEEVDAILAKKPDFDPNNIEIPERAKYPKAVFFCGIIIPEQISKLLSRKELKEAKVIGLVDNDPDFLRAAFQRYNYVGIISSPAFHFLLGKTEAEWQTELYEVFKVPPASDYFAVNLTFYHPNLNQAEVSFYKLLAPILHKMQAMLLANLGYIDDYLEGIRATAANEHFIRKCPGIQDLRDKYKGIPAFIVGAGPSLDADIELLKANQDKGIIIAADASVKSLIANGIRVDYATSIERWVDIQAKFWDNLPEDKLPELIALPVVHTEVLKSYAGRIRIPYRNYAYYLHWEKQIPHGIIHSFSNTGHLSFRMARYMGCSRYILIGMDNCYKQVEESSRYISHAKNPGFPEWGEAHEREDIIRKHDYNQPYFDVATNSGKTTLSNRIYKKWADEWSQEAIVLNLHDQIVNTAKDGIAINRIKYQPLEEIVKDLPAINFPPSSWKETAAEQSLNYEILFQNLEAYSSLYQRLKKELNGLIVTGFKDIDGLAYYNYVINGYMRQDPFQMSWITQNCTREMAIILNNLAVLSDDPRNDTKDEWKARINLCIQQLDTFSDLCHRIISTIKQGVDDGKQILQQDSGRSKAS